MDWMKLLQLKGKRKFGTASGGLAAICFIASLVSSGGLTIPVGIAFGVIAGAVSIAHNKYQGAVDEKEIESKVEKCANH